jgi:antitoxin CptB
MKMPLSVAVQRGRFHLGGAGAIPMSTETRMSLDNSVLDPRRKRVRFRAWHRGMQEMDIILGRFADAELAGLSEAELDRLEALMALPDPTLFAWITGMEPIPESADITLIRRIAEFRQPG